MITTHKVPYGRGELRIGWASWDDGKFEERSIKYAYRDSSGKISRGSPELPFDHDQRAMLRVVLPHVVLNALQKKLVGRHVQRSIRVWCRRAFGGTACRPALAMMTVWRLATWSK